MSQPAISVVIPAHNEGENLADTVACVLDSAAGLEVELIVVDDASTDGSPDLVRRRFSRGGPVRVVVGAGLGVAGARNLGARHACGELLVFLDGHCYTPPGWLQSLTAPLEDPAVGIVGPTIASLVAPDNPAGCGARWVNAALEWQWLPGSAGDAQPVALLPGGCQAMRRADFERLGGFDGGMTRWGSEDYELTLRCWLMGFEAMGQGAAVVYHLFREQAAYPVAYDGVVYNRLRLALLHFSDERCARVIESHRECPGFAPAMLRLLQSDAPRRRERLRRQRRRGDDWFFERFGPAI